MYYEFIFIIIRSSAFSGVLWVHTPLGRGHSSHIEKYIITLFTPLCP
jgi:hypothetical protein